MQQKDDYMKAVRKITELGIDLKKANERVEFLESVLEDFRTSDLCRIGAEIANKGTSARISDIEGLTGRNISDAGRQIQSLTNKVSELEESLSITFDAAKSNWDSYQMEALKTEKLSAENLILSAVAKTCFHCKFNTGELYGCPIQHHIFGESGWCNQRELITSENPS